MTSRPIHAARPGLTGNHRTDAFPCRCDPWRLADMNEPGRVVLVHRPFDEDADTAEAGDDRGRAHEPARSELRTPALDK
jgi:hypothetical protein